MLLSCDNECTISRIKMFEVVMRMRRETVLHEYPVLWLWSQWLETTSVVKLFFSRPHIHTLNPTVANMVLTILRRSHNRAAILKWANESELCKYYKTNISIYSTLVSFTVSGNHSTSHPHSCVSHPRRCDNNHHCVLFPTMKTSVSRAMKSTFDDVYL